MRVKRGIISRRKHKKVLELTKGFRGSRSRLIRTAKAASIQAGQYAFHGRKLRKRNFRTLWITRISEAVKQENMSYSIFVHKLKDSHIEIDRKIMSDILLHDPETFQAIISHVKSSAN